METVRTVEYSVLISGNPLRHITPQQGLRRGDVRSPYLYIVRADVLSHSIEVNTSAGRIRGIQHIGTRIPKNCRTLNDCVQ